MTPVSVAFSMMLQMVKHLVEGQPWTPIGGANSAPIHIPWQKTPLLPSLFYFGFGRPNRASAGERQSSTRHGAQKWMRAASSIARCRL